MDTVENTSIPKVAYQRYQTTLEEYKEALRADATVSFFSFCRNKHVNYDGIKKWASEKGESIMALKRAARGDVPIPERSATPSEPTFIQFRPGSSIRSSKLRNVSITFPDGVNLTLQESVVEEVIALLDAYQSRHQARGGAQSCSR